MQNEFRFRAAAGCAGSRPLLTGICLAALVPAAFAGRPLRVDDAGAVATGQAELEGGFQCVNGADSRHYDLPFGLTVGLGRGVEAGIGSGHLHEQEQTAGGYQTHSGVGDLVAGLKWNPLAEEHHWAGQALAFSVKFPTADSQNGFGSGKADFDLTYIASKTLSDRVSAHFNAGYTWTGDSAGQRADDIAHTGVAVGYHARTNLELVAEVYADVPLTDEENSSVTAGVGVRWAVVDSLVLDVAAGAGLRRPAPDWMATAGFTWTFGLIPWKGGR